MVSRMKSINKKGGLLKCSWIPNDNNIYIIKTRLLCVCLFVRIVLKQSVQSLQDSKYCCDSSKYANSDQLEVSQKLGGQKYYLPRTEDNSV